MDYFNFHTHRSTNQPEILELVNQYPQDFDEIIPVFSIGIHPWYITEDRIEADLKIIESKLQQKNCLAIGECGLDKRIEIPMELQQSVFEKQLVLAEKYRKPVVIHCVAAFQEVMDTKKKLNISVPMIIHGFSKNEQIAQQLIANGFYLSFGKYLLRNPELETVFQSISNDKFLLETDTVEEGIQEVYALAAKYKNIDLKKLQNIIQHNFNTIFKNGRVD
ncbi:TatD family hydrolase [Flavobacterium sp. GT3R68]|uniref:TatD family hydrolase n=1 Tax=Flavobacterium sp. GT3R68 TaxID=2594437 RepID=UPI000F87E287|nr:TatD family hydrolase [Flavobacterium sp. GT3R68]RTY95045.1 TatD family deoxyribonuclease [Flavobacterium sp. GSN2]TRW91851.1 TatD family deoxyribonuclease [Flavobacterium sp. GT3R68]